MKYPNYRLLPVWSAVTALMLAGCGGDSDSESPAQPSVPPSVPVVSVSGVVLVGALDKAKVCLDINDNRACDASEPSTNSDASGSYTLAGVTEADLAAHPLMAEAVPGVTSDADYGVVSQAFRLAAPAGKSAVISAYTTLQQSEIDGGRAANLAQADENILDYLVGLAGDVGGLGLASNYLPLATDTTAQATKRLRMHGLAQLLVRGFAATQASSGLTGKAGMAALGQVATGSLQQMLSQVSGKLSAADRETLYLALKDSLVPTSAHLADLARVKDKTAAAPIEGAWIRSTVVGSAVVKELYLFAGDGTFLHRTLDAAVPAATSTVFDNGLAYRYGRYSLSGGTLTTSLIEASGAAGPTNGTLTDVTVSGNNLTAAGGIALTRVTSASKPLVGGWLRANGSNAPEFLVMFDDGSYAHSTFYYQNDPQTATATFFETAKSAGLRKGTYAVDAANSSIVNFGATTVLFNGTRAIPSDPGVGTLQADGSLTMTGLRLVKLGSSEGAKAVSGLSEATRSRLWSGRFFSRNVTVAAATRLQYVYVRGPNDVLTFLQPLAGANTALVCGSDPATQGTPLPDFSSVAPTDGKLKQFVVGTSTAATAGYAQRRFNIGLPGTGNFVTYTPIAKPSTATARCTWPL